VGIVKGGFRRRQAVKQMGISPADGQCLPSGGAHHRLPICSASHHARPELLIAGQPAGLAVKKIIRLLLIQGIRYGRDCSSFSSLRQQYMSNLTYTAVTAYNIFTQLTKHIYNTTLCLLQQQYWSNKTCY
jgi:hypothetical protein